MNFSSHVNSPPSEDLTSSGSRGGQRTAREAAEFGSVEEATELMNKEKKTNLQKADPSGKRRSKGPQSWNLPRSPGNRGGSCRRTSWLAYFSMIMRRHCPESLFRRERSLWGGFFVLISRKPGWSCKILQLAVD